MEFIHEIAKEGTSYEDEISLIRTGLKLMSEKSLDRKDSIKNQSKIDKEVKLLPKTPIKAYAEYERIMDKLDREAQNLGLVERYELYYMKEDEMRKRFKSSPELKKLADRAIEMKRLGEKLGDEEWDAKATANERIKNGGEEEESDVSDFGKKYNWTEDEDSSVKAYMDNAGYEEINEALRYGDADEWMKRIKKDINSALKKVPAFEGMVYRGIKIDKSELRSFLRRYKERGEVIERGFLSTSLSKKKALEFTLDDGEGEEMIPILFTINSKSGGNISELQPEEKEVLFRTSTKFKVQDVTVKSGRVSITLDELDKNS